MLWLQDSQDYRKDVARIALKDVKYRGRGANNEPEPHHGGVARTLDLAPEKTARKENIRHIGVTLVMYYPLRVLLGFLFALLAFVRGIDVLCPRVRSKLWKKSGLRRKVCDSPAGILGDKESPRSPLLGTSEECIGGAALYNASLSGSKKRASPESLTV